MLRTWRQRITVTDIVIWAIGLAIAVMVVYGSIKTSHKKPLVKQREAGQVPVSYLNF